MREAWWQPNASIPHPASRIPGPTRRRSRHCSISRARVATSCSWAVRRGTRKDWPAWWLASTSWVRTPRRTRRSCRCSAWSSAPPSSRCDSPSPAASSWARSWRGRRGSRRRSGCSCGGGGSSSRTSARRSPTASPSWPPATACSWAKSASSTGLAFDRGRRGIDRRVHPVDQRLVVLLHRPALDLEGRGELARVDREVALDQGDLLRHLELREVAQHPHDLALHLRLHVGQRDQLDPRPVG